MKVMQIIRRIRFAEWGGTENVVWNSSRELLANGIDTEILATNALGGPRSACRWQPECLF